MLEGNQENHKRKRPNARHQQQKRPRVAIETLLPTEESPSTEELHQIGFPNELVAYLLSFLDAEDLAQLSLVDTYFYNMANSNIVWNALIHRDCPYLLDTEEDEYPQPPKALYIDEIPFVKRSRLIKNYFPGIDSALVIDILRGNNNFKNACHIDPMTRIFLTMLCAVNGDFDAQRKIPSGLIHADFIRILSLAFVTSDLQGLIWAWENCSHLVLNDRSALYKILPLAGHLTVDAFTWLWEQLDDSLQDTFTSYVFNNACQQGNLALVKYLCSNYGSKISLERGFESAARTRKTQIIKWMLDNANLSEYIIDKVRTGYIVNAIRYPQVSINVIEQHLKKQREENNEEFNSVTNIDREKPPFL